MKKIFLEFLQSLPTSVVFSQFALLDFCSSKSDLGEIKEFLDNEAKSAIVCNSPKTYDVVKFIALVEALPDTEKTIIQKDQTKFDIIDGRFDPNQPKIIRTKSYNELAEIMSAEYPLNIYVSGETGLGKTTAIIAIAKELNIPVVRVNISGATDIDDLLGGIRIIDGNTIFDPGPVAIAMEMGAILLLDEVDAGNPKILIDLHAVLEKKGVLIKKARKMLYPSAGFRVIATGNSKGQGDVTGRYIGVTPMNHAFLQRFGAGIDFKPPLEHEMVEIMQDAFPKLPINITLNLCKWYYHVYTTFQSGAISDYIHVRKMLDIAMTCLIFNAKTCDDSGVPKAIKRTMNLYDEPLVDSFIALYETIKDSDLGIKTQSNLNSPDEPFRIDEKGEEIPF